jgi:hypothetical protein
MNSELRKQYSMAAFRNGPSWSTGGSESSFSGDLLAIGESANQEADRRTISNFCDMLTNPNPCPPTKLFVAGSY